MSCPTSRILPWLAKHYFSEAIIYWTPSGLSRGTLVGNYKKANRTRSVRAKAPS